MFPFTMIVAKPEPEPEPFQRFPQTKDVHKKVFQGFTEMAKIRDSLIRKWKKYITEYDTDFETFREMYQKYLVLNVYTYLKFDNNLNLELIVKEFKSHGFKKTDGRRDRMSYNDKYSRTVGNNSTIKCFFSSLDSKVMDLRLLYTFSNPDEIYALIDQHTEDIDDISDEFGEYVEKNLHKFFIKG